MKGPGPYEERDARASRLAGERPHAAEMLGLYRRVLSAQRPRYERVAASRWLRRSGGSPDALPFGKLVRPFRAYASEVASEAPDALAAVGEAVADAPSDALEELLERTAGLEDLDEVAGELGCEVLPLVFYARGFLQPVAEGLAARAAAGNGGGNGRPRAGAGSRLPLVGNGGPGAGAGGGNGRSHADVGVAEEAADEGPAACPRCGWPPQVALLRDEPDAKGRRLLVCGLCATVWPFPRLRCPSCGEADSEKLLFHGSEGEPYIQVAECASCRAYLKTVDLREQGSAVPLVEDLASPELDVWADEHGLWKISRNLLGM